MRLDPSQEPNEGPANGGPQETLVHGAAETQQLDRQLPSCCPQLSAAHPLPAHCRAGHRAVSQAGLRCIPQRHQRGVQVGRSPPFTLSQPVVRIRMTFVRIRILNKKCIYFK